MHVGRHGLDTPVLIRIFIKKMLKNTADTKAYKFREGGGTLLKIKSKTDILVSRGKDNTSFIKGVHMIRNQKADRW